MKLNLQNQRRIVVSGLFWSFKFRLLDIVSDLEFSISNFR